MTNRTQQLKKAYLDAPFEICAERAVFWTESQRLTEGRPQVIRNALALKNVLEKMTIAIHDGELIVGNRTRKRKGSPLFPETKSFSIESQLDTYATRPIQPYQVGDAEKRALRKILPYWRNRSAWDRAYQLMPRDLQNEVFKFVFIVEAEFQNGIGHFIAGNPSLLKKGLAGIRDDSQKKIDALDAGPDSRKDFWEAVKITSDAAISFAARFSAEAMRLAQSEKDPQRKKELLAIVQTCENVPARAPRNFPEAVQAVWFNQLICQLECGGFAISPGRLDQLLYPFYKRDLDQGRITPAQAQELIECLFIKMSEVVNALDTMVLAVTSGPPLAQSMTVGGIDCEGKDATNDLSYLFVKAMDEIRTVWPNMAVRFHPKTPRDFLLQVCDAVRRGTMMALFNDEVIVRALEKKGVAVPDARDYAIVGCVEPTAPGKTFASTDANLLNIARGLEFALKNGDGTDLLAHSFLSRRFSRYLFPARRDGSRYAPSRLPHYLMQIRYLLQMARKSNAGLLDLYWAMRGKKVGPRTGDAAKFESIDEVVAAFEKQISYFVKQMVEAMHCCDQAHAELKPTPFISSTIEGCVESGKDVTVGGAIYNFTGPQAVGLADVADSLAAIKKLVFDERKISMAELIAALDKNFEGSEPLQQMLLNKAPKFGNDEEEVDLLAKQVAAIYCREVAKHKNFRGGIFSPGIYSMSSHLVFGILTGALPDGRQKGDLLAAGVSPVRGREKKGPTAIMRSVARVDSELVSNGYVLNMSFSPQLVAGPENLEKFADLNQTYFRLGGLQVQHNIVDADTLREAQKSPDQWRGLVVRVAGYSALFTELDRATQDDIIARTMHGCEGVPEPKKDCV